MTQNLDLSIGGTGVATLNSNNTDISTDPNVYASSGIYSDGYTENNGVWTWTSSSTAITSDHTISGTNVNNWGSSNIVPYSAEGGETYFYTSNSTNSDTKYTSLSSCVAASHTTQECAHYSAGNYYNWSTAIASNNSANISAQYDNADNSICPKGWRLPTATNSNETIYEFGNLLYEYDITQTRTGYGIPYKTNGFYNMRQSPLYLVRAGFITSGLNFQGQSGYYWSSTVYDNNGAYRLYFTSSSASPASGQDDRAGGRPIRCIAR